MNEREGIERLQAAFLRQGFAERRLMLGVLQYARQHIDLGAEMVVTVGPEGGKLKFHFEVVKKDENWYRYLAILVNDMAAAVLLVNNDVELIERSFHELYLFGESNALAGCTFSKPAPADEEWPDVVDEDGS